MESKIRSIKAARGIEKAECVLKNATYVNVFTKELLTGDIAITEGRIVGIGKYDGDVTFDMTGKIVCPGFIDAHIHLESSLVIPSEFAKAVVPHGTTAVVTDPHEIANVMGTDGIDYMLQATEDLPIDVMFMLPSCVPSTPLDEAGAVLLAEDIEKYYDNPRVLGLAEVMNAYGVTHLDEDVLAKIVSAQSHNAQVDGHAPGITGYDLNAYVVAGVRSDHECSDFGEAMEKIRLGQCVQIREGTAAKNLEALSPLLRNGYEDRCMLCTDDKHPNDLLEKGHIDYIIKEAIHKYQVDPIVAIKAATYNSARFYQMKNKGAVAPGYVADLVVLDDFEHFEIEKVFKAGKLVCDQGIITAIVNPKTVTDLDHKAHNTFDVKALAHNSFATSEALGCIGMMPGSIVTKDLGVREEMNLEEDVLKIAVVERHKRTGHIGIGFIKGYGLKHGAIATSISHDSHNIIVVGTNEKDMVFAANQILLNQGGIVVANDEKVTAEVTLEIAGLMSADDLKTVNDNLEHAKKVAYEQGVNEGIDPFMSLSFMSLPVIPEIKLTTKGIVLVK